MHDQMHLEPWETKLILRLRQLSNNGEIDFVVLNLISKELFPALRRERLIPAPHFGPMCYNVLESDPLVLADVTLDNTSP